MRMPSCMLPVDATALGYIGDADLTAWPGAVQRVAARYPYKAIIPGHGSVDRDGAAYEHTLALLRRPAP